MQNNLNGKQISHGIPLEPGHNENQSPAEVDQIIKIFSLNFERAQKLEEGHRHDNGKEKTKKQLTTRNNQSSYLAGTWLEKQRSMYAKSIITIGEVYVLENTYLWHSHPMMLCPGF